MVLAFVLRFWNLNNFPALNADEAAIGYNAYSLILTGKDEHRNSWPIHFQSFNDYKPGLYVYMVLPFVKVLGLNEWAVRIPGATLGVLTVLIVYFLIRELRIGNWKFEIIAPALLAINPWHIHFSRGGWEVNMATFFMTAGLWLFVKAANNGFNVKYLVLSVLAFVAAIYDYHAARVVVPLLGIFLAVKYWREIKNNFRKVVPAVIIGIILLVPLAVDFSKGGVFSRAAGAGLFADPGPLSRVNEQRGEHDSFSGIAAKVLHNKVVNYSLAFAKNLTGHFSGEFLFLSGDVIERNRVPETGQLYLIELVFVVVGLVAIVKNSKGWGVIIWWLLVAPSAAALTFQAPHALRSQNMVIPLTMISSFGLYKILEFMNKFKKIKVWLYSLLVLALILSFARYLHVYWIHMAKEYPYSSQYGVKELVNYLKEKESGYQKILVTNRYDQPYILFLFYMKYDPVKFQNSHSLTPRDGFGFSTVNHFDKYYFATIKFDQARPENPNALIVGTDGEIPEEANIVKDIYGVNGYRYFQVVAN